MLAAVNHGQGDLRVEEVGLPDLGPNDVLVEVSYCGICGSDLHFVIEGWGRPGSTGGHEWSGVVAAAGHEVTKWKLGDRVIGGPGHGCGECLLCRTGRPSLCQHRGTPGTSPGGGGAFARFTRAGADSLLRVPDGLSLREAALSEPLAVAVHACATAGAEPGQRVLVSGAGPIGLLVVVVLNAWGIEDIVVSEPGQARRDLARAVGATATVAPDRLTRPRMPMDLVDSPFDAVLECSGNAVAQETAVYQLGRAGRLVLVGAGMGRPKFDPNRILLNELVITGSNEYWEGDFQRAIDLLCSGALPTDLLIERSDVTLHGLLDAMMGLNAGEIPGKVMVVPGVSSTSSAG